MMNGKPGSAETELAYHVLLVEDNPGDIRLIREMLFEAQDENIRLETVDTLAKAIERIGKEDIDAVLLDLNLPDSHGFDTFNRVTSKAPKIAVIILTGLNDEALALEAVRAGAQDYLVKGSFNGALLTRAIRYAMERKKLLLMRDKFVSMVSHELRNPLAVLHGSISQAFEDLRPLLGQDQQELFEMAQRAIDRLLRTTNNLLDLAKMEAGKMSIQETQFDIAALAREIGATFAGAIKTKGLILTEKIPGHPIKVTADRDKISEVFTNLMTNALKFTGAGSIEIEVRDGHTFVGCSVADTGTGIPEENLPKLFNKFEQFGRKSGEGAKGTGLGLAICKEIIERHGGRIWAESTHGRGSRFIFSIPK